MAVETVYKLLTRAAWEAAQAAGVYYGSEHDMRDGFIHFSTAGQLAGTARKHFAGVADLVLLAVRVEGLSELVTPHPVPLPLGEGKLAPPARPDSLSHGERGDALRFEPARDGDLFPHLYAPLPAAAVISATAIPLDAAGIPILPSRLEP